MLMYINIHDTHMARLVEIMYAAMCQSRRIHKERQILQFQ